MKRWPKLSWQITVALAGSILVLTQAISAAAVIGPRKPATTPIPIANAEACWGFILVGETYLTLRAATRRFVA